MSDDTIENSLRCARCAQPAILPVQPIPIQQSNSIQFDDSLQFYAPPDVCAPRAAEGGCALVEFNWIVELDWIVELNWGVELNIYEN